MFVPVIRRWETASRYYETRIDVDLYDNQVLRKIWGGRSTKRGGQRVVAIGGESCRKALLAIEIERARNGYTEVYPVSYPCGSGIPLE